MLVGHALKYKYAELSESQPPHLVKPVFTEKHYRYKEKLTDISFGCFDLMTHTRLNDIEDLESEVQAMVGIANSLFGALELKATDVHIYSIPSRNAKLDKCEHLLLKVVLRWLEL